MLIRIVGAAPVVVGHTFIFRAAFCTIVVPKAVAVFRFFFGADILVYEGSIILTVFRCDKKIFVEPIVEPLVNHYHIRCRS